MPVQGGYGPDRQFISASSWGSLQGIITVIAEDGITPLGKSAVTVRAGTRRNQLVVGGGIVSGWGCSRFTGGIYRAN